MTVDSSKATFSRGAVDLDHTEGHTTDFTTPLSESWHNSTPRVYVTDPQCQVAYKDFRYFSKDNPASTITPDAELVAIKVVCGALMPPLGFSGLLLNVVNMLVFWKQGLRERINFLLFCLSCVDFVLLIQITMYSTDFFFTFLEGPFHVVGPVHEIMANKQIFVLYGFVFESGFISTMIALERYICISHPFIAKKILKTKVAGIIVVVSTAVLVGGHSIVADKYRVRCEYNPDKGFTLRGYSPSQFYLENRFLVDVFNSVVYGLALPIFFFLTTSVTTVITAVKLRSAARWRRGQTSVAETDGKEVALTRMLISVSCVFIVCSIPTIMFKLAHIFLPGFTVGDNRNQNLILLGLCLIHYFPAINSSVNFFFYVKMGSRYRAELKSLFCPARWKTKKAVEIQETNTSTFSSVQKY